MAIQPRDIIQYYHNIRVMPCHREGGPDRPVLAPGVGTLGLIQMALSEGMQTVAIRRYRSAMTSDSETGAVRRLLYEDLRHFAKQQHHYSGGANGASHTRVGSVITSPRLRHGSRVDIDSRTIQTIFNGSGFPDHFQRFLTLLDLYLATAVPKPALVNAITKDGSKRLSLQEFADKYLGIDCNAFAGAYLHFAHPGSRFSKSGNTRFDMDAAFANFAFKFEKEKGNKNKFEKAADGTYKKDGKGRKIPVGKRNTHTRGSQYERVTSYDDITPGCLLIDPRDWENYAQHVAVIQSVSTVAGETGVRVTTAESRSAQEDGVSQGPCTRDGMLRFIDRPLRSDMSNYGYWTYCRRNFKLLLKPRT